MGEDHRPSDEELMAAYAGGDEKAFPALFERYSPLLLKLMRTGLASEEESRDLVQQTFLQLHRARRDYSADRPLRPWLLTIAYNLKRDHWRRRGRRPEAPLSTEVVNGRADQGKALEAKHQARRLHQALARLPEDQRQVIELHWFGEIPFPEIATTVGASLSAVKVRAHRGYQRLRELLKKV